MPLLFYGVLPNKRKRRLYSKNLREIETSLFDHFKIKDLAPYSRLHHVANFWHLISLDTTAIAWHTDDGEKEQVIFIPGIHNQIDSLAIARLEFGSVMPGATTFRFNNKVYVHEYT